MRRKDLEAGIFEFDPVIYPVRIWVGINPSFNDISSKFYGLDSEMEKLHVTEEMCTHDRFVVARTFTVADKEKGWFGLLIGIYKPKNCKVDNICHESAHCADFICEQLGITNGDFDNGEAYAYLIGWIAKCIDSVLRNKTANYPR